MSKIGAYIIRLNHERQQVFEHESGLSDFFAEAVREFTYSRNQALICFIVNSNGDITHVGQGKRGFRAATAMRRLNVYDITALTTGLSSSKIIDAVPSRVRHWVSKKFEGGGLLSPKSFEHVVDVVTRIAPETGPLLDRFSRIARERLARLSEAKKTALAYQKESVATALFVSDMDRSSLADWAIKTESEPKSFLDGLSEARLLEDSMIVQDMQNVPGYEYIRTIPNASAAFFKDEDTTLAVILANRQQLERQTGTDLIYYNETFKAFIMVQYKAMERHGEEGAIFRYPQNQLSIEIQRMDTLLATLRQAELSISRDNFRFSDNPFFLKFCPRLQFDPYNTGLTTGMYLPLGYWKMIEEDADMCGAQGGKRLTYSNVGRYLDNSAFGMLVSRAWVGTSAPQSSLLEDWIREIIEHGRAVTFAVKKNRDPFSGYTGGVSDFDPTV